MSRKGFSGSGGFTLIELLIVITIMGIIASFVIPSYLGVKDKTIWGVTKANLDVIRTALANYAANSVETRYPLSIPGWANLVALLPESNLPPSSVEAKIEAGSFSYGSSAGGNFTVTVTSTNKYEDVLTAEPSGISPEKYPR